MEKKKTKEEFRSDIRKKYGWNAPIGFWHGYYYQLYKRDRLTYDDIMADIATLADYTGV